MANPNVLHIDFETQSNIDLRDHSVVRYVAHPSFRVVSAAYAWGDEPVQTWRFDRDDIQILKNEIWRAGLTGEIWAHNAAFEYEVITRGLGLAIDPRKFHCTMAMAYASSYPGGLEVLCEALGMEVGKYGAGRDAMLFFNRYKRGTVECHDPRDYPDKFDDLVKYNAIDVEMEREAAKRMRPLHPYERKIFELDWKINRRGIAVDIQACEMALQRAFKNGESANGRIETLTGGAIETINQKVALLAWAQKRGFDKDNFRKQTLLDFLTEADDSINSELIEAIKIVLGASKTSTKKFQKILDVELGGRLHWLFQYHGANTGRWAGRDVQLQNLPRPVKGADDPEFQEQLIYALKYEDDLALKHNTQRFSEMIESLPYSDMEVLSSLIRAVFMAKEGYVFVGADLANIEGRVLAWVANHRDLLNAFDLYDRGEGHDIYKIVAADMYQTTPDKIEKDSQERLLGKVATLACGYQGAIGAFKSMAKIYGVSLPEDQVNEIVQRWRNANKPIVKLWYDVQDCAMSVVSGACKRAGRKGKFMYYMDGKDLLCELPSGRRLSYPNAYIADHPKFEGAKALFYAGHPIQDGGRARGKWGGVGTYGGKLVENMVQAIARDVLAEGIMRMEANNLPVVLHVHDEIISEVPAGTEDLELFEKLLATPPEWAQDLPLAAEGFTGKRYRK